MGTHNAKVANLRLRRPIPYRLPHLIGAKVATLMPPAVFDRPLPLTGGSNSYDHWVGKKPHPFAPCQIVTVPDGYATNLGHVLDRHGRLVHNATHKIRPTRGRLGWYINSASFRDLVRRHDVEKFDGPVAPMTASNERMYGHWLIDTLPRYRLLADAKFADIPIYISTQHPFQRETIERLGHPHVIAAEQHPFIVADKLCVPSHQMTQGYEIPKWAVQYIRKLFADEIAVAGKPLRRLYLSRAGVGRRKLDNEDEIAALLAGLGFEIFEPQKYSVSEQARIFATAEAIIGPSGSAFANIVFCRPGVKIVSFSVKNEGDFVYRLAAACSHDYWYVCSRGDGLEMGMQANYDIDIGDLRATLSLAGIM